MPNFLIIGAMKSGTTTLYDSLNAHPQIYMSRLKEPHFFSYDGTENFPITNLEDYQALFRGVSNETAIGEASTTYLFNSKAPERIRHYIPKAKLIAILRDPAERAYSLYLMRYRANQLKTQISDYEILNYFAQLVHKKSGGTLNERYCASLKRYLSIFDQEQIKICFYQDLKSDPNTLLQDIYKFLGVDENLLIHKPIKRSNTGGIPSNKSLHTSLENLKKSFNATIGPLLPESLFQPLESIYTSLRNRNLVKAPPLPREIRKQLIEIYREDILHLQDFLQRDFSKWLEC
ncbi:MAG: sulfotransferase domain-containing protein [Symploca sp. SIO2E9]|nr:sulfotransferase domain-containing protein [Symploca sp. SIO2E9]